MAQASGVIADDSAAAEQRAKAVEARVVEEYGTPAQIYAYKNPHRVPPGLKKPKFPKNPHGPEDMAEYMDFMVYSMEPEQIFVTVFNVGLYERYLKGAFSGQTKQEKERERTITLTATVASQAAKGLAYMPGGSIASPFISMAIQEIAKRALEKERASEEERQAAAEGLALAAGLDTYLKDHFSKEEMAEYSGAGARAKAAQLLRLTDTMLRRQEVPSAYVIVATKQLERSPMSRNTDLAQTERMFGGDPHFEQASWNGMTREQRWRAVTDGLHRLLRDGQESMAEPGRAAAFLERLGFPADRSGSSAVLGTFGPSALPQYRKASPEERRGMELDARVIHAASELVARLSIGDKDSEQP